MRNNHPMNDNEVVSAVFGGLIIYMISVLLTYFFLHDDLGYGDKIKPKWSALIALVLPGFNTVIAAIAILYWVVSFLVENTPSFIHHAPEWVFGKGEEMAERSQAPILPQHEHDWVHIDNVRSDEEKEKMGGMLSLWQCRKCKHYRGRGTMQYSCTPENFYNDDEGNVEGGERDYGLVPPIRVADCYYPPTTNQA